MDEWVTLNELPDAYRIQATKRSLKQGYKLKEIWFLKFRIDNYGEVLIRDDYLLADIFQV